MQPRLVKLALALERRALGVELEALRVVAALDVAELRLELELLLALVVAPQREVAVEALDRELRLREVELDDRLAGLHRVTRPLAHAQHARVDRAGEHLLHLRQRRGRPR